MHRKMKNAVATTMGYPAPPSPTLTNPDMILPVSEYDAAHATPGDQVGSSNAWTGDDLQLSGSGYIGMAIGPSTPTTPIIYGNGTMLSDIGEVTEVESTPAKKVKTPQGQRKIQIQDDQHDMQVRSSPTIGYEAVLKRSKFGNHQRHVSVESTSTIRTADEQSAEVHDNDFEDDISVDESGFGGDDEESVADETYEHQVAVAQAALVARKDSVKKIMTEEGASGALSRRAEMILANAKKRLDNMEGNLNRARSSLYLTPSSSMPSIQSNNSLNHSSPSPTNDRIHPQAGRLSARYRQGSSDGSPSSQGHARISSETSIYPGAHNRSPVSGRSASAAAAEHYEQIHGQSRDTDSNKFKASPLGSRSNTPLAVLSEDDRSDAFHGERSATAEPYMSPHWEQRVVTRSSSSMQMRDLTGKMRDLKGKIGQLRERAREDQLRRRSLQSLRTPSPFTASENWRDSNGYAGESNRNSVVFSPWNGEPSVAEEDETPEEEEVAQNLHGQASNAARIDADVEETVEQKDDYDERFADPEEVVDEYPEELVEREHEEERSESEASQYHDTFTTPVSHEDREDAFDYEHFFLHSAMGTISQQRLSRRDSVGSYESEGSVETARGLSPVRPSSQDDMHELQGHLKNQRSTDSVSTMNSFATATEGFSPGDEVPEDGESYISNTIATQLRPSTSRVEKRSTFGPGIGAAIGAAITSNSPNHSLENVTESQWMSESRPSPTTEGRPSSAPQNQYFVRPSLVKSRPSVSSFASSTGTTRSFPLVNRPKNATGSPAASTVSVSNTPPETTPLHEHPPSLTNSFSAPALSNGNASGAHANGNPVAGLEKADQFLVERVVASLGKCVLGLQDDGVGSVEGRMWRRRLELARKVLEGEVSI